MSSIAEFKKFAMKGNLIDLAVAFVIGAAFNKIINAVVEDLIMPIVGVLLPSGDWRDWTVTPLHIKVGNLIGVMIDFLVIAITLFVVVRFIEKFRVATSDTKECPKCLEKIPIKASRCKACSFGLVDHV